MHNIPSYAITKKGVVSNIRNSLKTEENISHTEIYAPRGCALDSVWKMSADADPDPVPSLVSET